MTTHATMGDPVLETVTAKMVEYLKPERIILFGSRSRGDSNPDSDYDFLIEMKTDLRKPEREIAVHKLFRYRDWSMDVFVYTPEEIRRWRDDVGTIVHMAENEGRVLYERTSNLEPVV